MKNYVIQDCTMTTMRNYILYWVSMAQNFFADDHANNIRYDIFVVPRLLARFRRFF
jgi:hypothetical protein